jgi:hypothetical protein
LNDYSSWLAPAFQLAGLLLPALSHLMKLLTVYKAQSQMQHAAGAAGRN